MVADWELRFPGCEPVAHRLRVEFRARWVRFHNLPESKRYPEDESEYETVLVRHNCVLSELLGAKQKVILLTTGYSDDPNVISPDPELRDLVPNAMLWRSVPMHAGDGFDHPSYWHVFASECDWYPGALNPIVRLAANDAIHNVMVVAPDSRWLLHPYDGGMDVIVGSPAERDHFKLLHRDWLSSRSDGL